MHVESDILVVAHKGAPPCQSWFPQPNLTQSGAPFHNAWLDEAFSSAEARRVRGSKPNVLIPACQGTCPAIRILSFHEFDPLTRPAPAGESAGCGPPSPPKGRGLSLSHSTVPFFHKLGI